jgi:ATP-dependent RNA helicase RhlE
LSSALSPRIPPLTETSSARATSFAELGLLPELLKAVAEQGYTEPTPIQAQAIPLVLEGRDVMGAAQTGTGKTAGFTLPLLHRLARHANTSASPARHPVRALILTPTRELAAQIEESVRTYGKYIALRSTVVFGGIDMKPQTAALRQGVEFLVATPGRLLDHVQQKTANLQQVEAFVLDEADRMLDMGFIPDVRRIMSLLPKRRQNLLFSATLTGEIRTLADSFLHDPVLVQVARNNAAADSVTHVVHPVRRERKRELLGYLIQSRALSQVLVFTSTRIGANRLAYQLNRDGIHAAAIHGDKSQPERLQALDDFKSGRVGVLVATDVAARGLDIEDLPYVVNFELPGAPEDYVHRIGRTGRAGASGEAISLVCSEEHERLEAIEKLARLNIPRKIVPGFEPDVRVASSIIGTASSRRGGGPRERRPRHREQDSLTHSRQEAKNADPIFSSPYKPAEAPAAPRPTPQRAPRQVAALLGGLLKHK